MPPSQSRYENILFGVESGVAEIRLNRPHRLNAVVEGLYRDILSALDAALTDVTVRVIVLTGEGRAFCVGADLKEHKDGARTPLQRRQYLELANAVCARVYAAEKPVIAAVNGFAFGAGAEMALSCDFIVMKDTAEIGFPELSLGTFIGGGISHVLPRLVGLVTARELIFTGRRINGVEAKAIGLVSRVADEAAFTTEVRSLATKIGGNAPLSMALAKDHLNRGSSRDFYSTQITELEGVRACMVTEDWSEGIRAFAEKRAPIFTGK
jgi:enoyl-CoA hydratase